MQRVELLGSSLGLDLGDSLLGGLLSLDFGLLDSLLGGNANENGHGSANLAIQRHGNLMGTGNCLEAVIPRMVARGQGQIGLVGSVSGYGGLPGGGVYGATKSALITMAEAMVPELRLKGVRLSVINPGFVKTALTDANDFPMPFMISAEDAAERIVKGLKAGRFEIAFPRRMALSLKLLSLLPYPLYFTLTSKMLRRG